MSATGQAISVNCPSCGKLLKIPGERAGKLAKCPGCMNTFTVPGGSGGPMGAGAVRLPGAGKPGAAGAKKEPSSFVVSPTLITFGTIALIVVGGIMAFVWGPLRVKGEWEKMEPTARDTCEDVVARGLDCYLSANMMLDVSKGRGMSGTKNFMFSAPFAMTMPEKVKFDGTSTQGMFKGAYHPRTGEVEADVEVGGTVLPSGVTVRRGDTTIHLTGRMKDGKLTVEVDGKPGEIVDWKKKLGGGTE